MRKIFLALLAVCALAYTASDRARAGTTDPCTSDSCRVLNSGHVRGRLPIACVPIPFAKEGYGEVAMFVVSSFNPAEAQTAEGLQHQLDTNTLFKDSKITGPVDNFCRNEKFFRGAYAVVLCDQHHWGAVRGNALAYAIRYKRAPWRVRIGTGR